MGFLLPLYRAYVQKQGWSQPVIRCLYEKGIPQGGADYSTAVSPLQQKLKIRLPSSATSSPFTLRKKKLSPGGRSGSSPGCGGMKARPLSSSVSDGSADFYSCLDDEEQFRHMDRKFSYDQHHVHEPATAFSTGGHRAPLFVPDEGEREEVEDGSRSHRHQVLVDGSGGVQEPFLAERGRRLKCSRGNGGRQEEEEELEGGEEMSCCCPSGRRCCRWLLCCPGL